MPVDWEPEVPVQPVGETEQEPALEEVQDIVAEVLYGMEIEPAEPLAVIVMVGAGTRVKAAVADLA